MESTSHMTAAAVGPRLRCFGGAVAQESRDVDDRLTRFAFLSGG
ncbi:MAG: hypothetical protein JWL83_4651 [Actinomycetia bacterium]|nr:hypothetical protein [Actinomycetes bacterium]